MPANTSPIFSIVGAVDSCASNNSGLIVGPTANTACDGTGTLYKIFTAGANGSYVQKIRFRPATTSGTGTPAATVARVFISSSTTTNATNTWLYDEITLPSAAQTNTAATSVFELPLNFALDPNYLLYVTFGTSTGASGIGYSVVVIGGDY